MATEGTVTNTVATPDVEKTYTDVANTISATPITSTATYESPYTLTSTGELAGAPQGASAESYMTPETTVSGQLEKILSSDSQLNKVTKANAAEQASALGMSSSSMAIGAAQKALVESALPIAQSDAQTAAAFKKSEQDLNYEQAKIETEAQVAGSLNIQKSQLAEQSAKIQAQWETMLQGAQAQANLQANLTTALQQGNINAEIQRQGAVQSERLTELQGTINQQLQKQQQDATLVLTTLEQNLQKQLQQQQIDAALQTQIMNQAQDMMNNYQVTVQQLLGNQVFLESMPNAAAMNSVFNDLFATVSSSIQFASKASGTYDANMQTAISSMIAANQW